MYPKTPNRVHKGGRPARESIRAGRPLKLFATVSVGRGGEEEPYAAVAPDVDDTDTLVGVEGYVGQFRILLRLDAVGGHVVDVNALQDEVHCLRGAVVRLDECSLAVAIVHNHLVGVYDGDVELRLVVT